MEHQETGTSHALEAPTAHRKRQKVAVACSPCRRKKIKCDAVRPVCTSCQKSLTWVECIYATRRKFGIDTPVDVASVESTRRDQSEIRSGSNCLQDVCPGERNEYGDKPRSGAPLYSQSTRADPHNVDSMNGMMGDPTQTSEVFGSSSAGTFMRQIQTAINAKLGPPLSTANEDTSGGRQISPAGRPRLCHEEAALSVLPLRSLADTLIRAYWDFDWVLYPIIDRAKFEGIYESLWTSTGGGCPRVSMSIINLCFALGCHYCESLAPMERRSIGNGFFSRAERLYQLDGQAPSLERVQCLLLLGCYLQSTDKAFQCWMMVGQAIRMAQCLGIHLNQPPASETVKDREIKRRVWHGCVWLDRVLSATFGRPGMIPKWLFNSIPLPSMIDDEFFGTQTEGSASRPDGRPCILAFAVKAFEFYQILDDILINIYLTSTRQDEFETKLTHIFEIDGKIHGWKQSLPGHLQYPPNGNGDATVNRQMIVLRIRYLHSRILLFRPALIYYCKLAASAYDTGNPHDSTDSSLSQVVLYDCSRLCFQLAHEVIDMFSSKLDPEALTGPLPSWWYSVLYVYTAATAILVECFLETRGHILREASDAYVTWYAAINVLKRYGLVAEPARRCVATLEVLFENLSLADQENTAPLHPADVDRDWSCFLEMSNFLGEESGAFPLNLDESLSI
ncbi:fungal-specific transcription factor domain-containing protein [Aspergillus parasiticus]|uniref:Fungal-specific transcription factor domain-containing protein n=1 Tax=Aspergillus parasiticus TaxID=5067 RepID=A0A5N6DPU4_ASPPA|nr:fungal-specific transcription factor domain-containing protein [Aspergillus parasiticus]